MSDGAASPMASHSGEGSAFPSSYKRSYDQLDNEADTNQNDTSSAQASSSRGEHAGERHKRARSETGLEESTGGSTSRTRGALSTADKGAIVDFDISSRGRCTFYRVGPYVYSP